MSGEPPSSQHTDAAIRGLFGRDSLYMMLWAIQLLLAAALTPVTTRILGPARFGFVASSVAVMQILVALGSFSLQTAVQRAYAEPDGEDRARRLVALAIGLSVATFVVAYGTGPIWAPIIGLGHFGPTVRFAVMWAALTAISNAALGLVRSRDQLGWFATVSLLQSVLAEALALSLVLLVQRTATDYVLGQMLAQAAAACVALAVARPRLARRSDWPMLFDALKYSSALVPAALSAFVLDASDRLVVQGDLGSAAVGRYAVARNIGGMGIIMLSVLNGVWMPRLFALKDAVTQRAVLAQSRDAVLSLVTAFAVAITMASPVLLWIWVPSSYHPDRLRLIVALIAVSALPMGAALSATRLLLLKSRTFVVGAGTMLAAAANLGLNLVLVPVFGVKGSALATLLCFGLSTAILGRAANKALPLPKPSPRLVAQTVTGVAICLLSSLISTSPVAIAVRMIVALTAGIVFGVRLMEMVAPDRLTRLRGRIAWLPGLRAGPAPEAGEGAA